MSGSAPSAPRSPVDQQAHERAPAAATQPLTAFHRVVETMKRGLAEVAAVLEQIKAEAGALTQRVSELEADLLRERAAREDAERVRAEDAQRSEQLLSALLARQSYIEHVVRAAQMFVAEPCAPSSATGTGMASAPTPLAPVLAEPLVDVDGGAGGEHQDIVAHASKRSRTTDGGAAVVTLATEPAMRERPSKVERTPLPPSLNAECAWVKMMVERCRKTNRLRDLAKRWPCSGALAPRGNSTRPVILCDQHTCREGLPNCDVLVEPTIDAVQLMCANCHTKSMRPRLPIHVAVAPNGQLHTVTPIVTEKL